MKYLWKLIRPNHLFLSQDICILHNYSKKEARLRVIQSYSSLLLQIRARVWFPEGWASASQCSQFRAQHALAPLASLWATFLKRRQEKSTGTDLPGTAVESHPPTQGLLSTLLNEIKPWFCLWALSSEWARQTNRSLLTLLSWCLPITSSHKLSRLPGHWPPQVFKSVLAE